MGFASHRDGGEVRVTSINAKGLNVPEKRKMLLKELKRSRTDVAFMQETHFKTGGLPLLQNRFFPCTYHAQNQTSKSRGVSILISNPVSWSLIDRWLDVNGRFLFLKGHIGGVKVTLATVYAPNTHQDIFISKTLTKLAEFAEGKMILGGDFNTPLDPSVDTSSGVSSISSGTRKSIVCKLQEIAGVTCRRERLHVLFQPASTVLPHRSFPGATLFISVGM